MVHVFLPVCTMFSFSFKIDSLNSKTKIYLKNSKYQYVASLCLVKLKLDLLKSMLWKTKTNILIIKDRNDNKKKRN